MTRRTASFTHLSREDVSREVGAMRDGLASGASPAGGESEEFNQGLPHNMVKIGNSRHCGRSAKRRQGRLLGSTLGFGASFRVKVTLSS